MENIITEVLFGSVGLLALVWIVVKSLLEQRAKQIELKDQKEKRELDSKKELLQVVQNINLINSFVFDKYSTFKDKEDMLKIIREYIVNNNMNSINAVYYCIFAEETYDKIKYKIGGSIC